MGASSADADLGPVHVAPAWPALVALAAVVGLSLASLGLDLVIGHQTAARTAQLVDDSLRSVALADDLRMQAHRLSTAAQGRSQLMAIAAQISADARAYDPIANGPGERAEWSNLQRLFERLLQDRTEPSSIAVLVGAIEQSIDRLIEIKERAARDNQAAITAIQDRGLIIDAVIGAITLALAIGVGLALWRSMRRQHQLRLMQVAAAGERNRELEAFAGRAAHDLRGPLAPMLGYADLLDAPGADVPAVAARIRHAAERMADLIDDLLALSVAGQVPAGRGDVAVVVREVLDDLSPDLRDAEVTLAVADCATACTPGVLAQMVRNLVANAIKYRRTDRRLRVEIAATPRPPRPPEPFEHIPERMSRASVRRNRRAQREPVPRGAPLIEIVVTDNGVGMTGEAAAHAFDPFYRASATRGIPGNGLGLAIVKRTLEAMGGGCDLVSAPDQGTRVTLHVPAAP